LTLSNPHKSLFYVLAVFALLSCATTPPAEIVKHPPRSGPVVLPQSSGRPVIAYALGSGAARGFAHVGVLNALDSAGISPDLIVGTS
jgi:NTE family protein